MGGMRWSIGRLERSEEHCRLMGVPYRTFETEEILPAPVVHVGPHFTTAPPEAARAGAEYVYLPRAHDASVSGFTWSLKKYPPGMEIDRYTGKIAWTPPASCRVEVELVAVTHHGRMAKQAWILSVGKPVAVRTVTPHPRYLEALRRKRLRTTGRRPFTASAHARRSTHSKSPADAATVPEACGRASEMPSARTLVTGSPLFRPWRAARKMAGNACRATAPPDHRPIAAALPLRL